MDIREVLKGLKAGKRQKVGLMTMIPLLADTGDDRFGPPNTLTVSTRTYGTVQFNNTADKDIIVPLHAAYLVKQAAQNHGMTHLGYVPKKGQKSYDTAACVQQSQGGTIAAGQHEFVIMPWNLREPALMKRSERSYSKLWNDIGELNASMGLQGRGHLEYFLEKVDKELEHFVAEFESVPNQIGAIILVNGRVAGIERAPNHDYWKAIWRPLIRECYGSLALQAGKSKTVFATAGQLDLSTPINSKKVKKVSDLLPALKEANAADDQKVKDMINNFIQAAFSVTTEKVGKDLNIDTVEHDQFFGQLVRDDAAVVYASLTTKQKYVKNSDWFGKPDFQM